MSAEIYFQTLEIIAQTLHEVPDEVLESQLQSFQMFVNLCGNDYRERSVQLLRDASARAEGARQALLSEAAEKLAAGSLIAETPVAPTATLEDWERMKAADPSLAGPKLLHLTPWDMFPGLAVRIGTTFTARGDTFYEGEILHFKSLDFLPYHEGYTLHFEERTMYLCGLDPADDDPLANSGNRYFEPHPSMRCLRATAALVWKQWFAADRSEVEGSRSIEEEIRACVHWLKAGGRPPFCMMSAAAQEAFAQAEGPDEGLGFRIAFLFVGVGNCPDENLTTTH
jgi:hypothetical protein